MRYKSFPDRFSFTKNNNTMSFHNGTHRFIVELKNNGMANFYWLHAEKQYIGKAIWNGMKFHNPPTLESADPTLIQYIEYKMQEYLPYYVSNAN